MQHNPLNKNGMHPQDFRNLIIFAIVSIALWSLYEMFVLQPATEAMQKREAIEQEIKQKQAEGIIENPSKILPREEVLAADTRLNIVNKELQGSLKVKSGRIDDLALRNYFKTLEEKENVVLLSPKSTEFPRYLNYGWVSPDKSLNLPGADTLWRVRSPGEELTPGNPLVLYWDNGQGLVFERRLEIDKDYMISITQKVINNSGAPVKLFPYGLISQTGLPPESRATFILHEGPIGWVGDELLEKNYKDLREEPRSEFQAREGWIGITEKYWLTALIPPQDTAVKFRFNHVKNAADSAKGKYQVDFLGAGQDIPPGGSYDLTSRAFVGAKQVLMLQDYQERHNIPNFDLAVDFGWLWFLTIPFFHILHFFNEWVGNFGVAIILLTVVIRTAVFPLTNTSYKSFAKMKKVAPQIAELREQYGENKSELQKQIVELYTREGVNPMAGCFPILLQIPIFFALYKVLFVTIEMRHAPFFGWIDDLSAPDPTSIFNLFGALPYDVPAFLQIGVWPCLMLVAMLIQKKLNPPPQDKLQRDMMNIFPFVITFIMAKFAAGLVIYWTFSAIISVIQQMIIMHRLGVPIHLLGQSEEEKKSEEGPDIHPIAEMAEEEVEEALFGEEEAHKAEEAAKKKISPPKKRKKKKKK